MKSLLLSAALGCILFSAPAFAQRFDTMNITNRLDRIERDLSYIQQQSARGGATSGRPISNAGQLTAEIARIDEEMRSLRGEIERAQFQNEQLQKQLASFQEDLEYRLQALEGRSAAPAGDDRASAEPMSMNGGSAPAAGSPPPAPRPLANENETQDYDADQDVFTGEVDSKLGAPSGDNPRDLYNEAFRLMNASDFAGAERAFADFIKNYPKDPLIGNAYYWLGETHYTRSNYAKAADSFRQGFEKLPNGPKAGDNLLKLAMSLSALKRNDEACVVLQQVDKKFGANSDALRSKARQEIGRLGCR
jgi:tol-pal system protein YbgF